MDAPRLLELAAAEAELLAAGEERAAGPPLADEAALGAWPAALDALLGPGVLKFAGAARQTSVPDAPAPGATVQRGVPAPRERPAVPV